MFPIVSAILMITETQVTVDLGAIIAGVAAIITAIGGAVAIWYTNRNALKQTAVSTETNVVHAVKEALSTELGTVHRRLTRQDEALAAQHEQIIEIGKRQYSQQADLDVAFGLLSEIDAKVTKTANSRSRAVKKETAEEPFVTV